MTNQEAIEYIKSIKGLFHTEIEGFYQALEKGIEELEKQKTGHWIADVDKWGDVVTTINGYKCSECGKFNTDKDNYCPNCGAKMVDTQEREE